RAFAERRPPVVRPVLAGRPGHPTLFDRAVLDRGLAGPLPEGARSLVASLGGAVLDLPVEDPGIVADIDTPEEYRRHFGRAPSEYVQQTSDSGAARHERLAHERGGRVSVTVLDAAAAALEARRGGPAVAVVARIPGEEGGPAARILVREDGT